VHTYVWTVGHETLGVARSNVRWMSWNLLLAAVPAVLAVLLFHRPRRQAVLWWAGVLFVAIWFGYEAMTAVVETVRRLWIDQRDRSAGPTPAG